MHRIGFTRITQQQKRSLMMAYRQGLHRRIGQQVRQTTSSTSKSTKGGTKSLKRNLSTTVLNPTAPQLSSTISKVVAATSTTTKLPDESWRLILPVIGNTAYMALASGFLMTDMLQLRVLLVGGYTGLVAFHALHPKPLQIPLRWSALFVLVNAGAVGFLLADRYGAPLSPENEELYHTHFAKYLTRGQFHQLLQLGTQQDIPQGSKMTQENHVCPRLFFIQEGQARVYHGTSAAIIDQGGFVNDVALNRSLSSDKSTTTTTTTESSSNNNGAYGTVIASRNIKALVWDMDQLRERLASSPELERNLKYCLSDHLVQSLLRQREASHQRQRRLTEEIKLQEEGTTFPKLHQ